MRILANLLLLFQHQRQNEIKSLQASENNARERMLHFKRELENRESTWNKRFTTNSGGRTPSSNPLRVQDDNATTAKQSKTARKKVRGKTAGTTTRKKKGPIKTKLPKI